MSGRASGSDVQQLGSASWVLLGRRSCRHLFFRNQPFWWEMGSIAKKWLHLRACVHAREYVPFCGGCGLHSRGVMSTNVCAGMYAIQVF